MLSETLSTALEGYAIGPKIRRLRLRKKLGLVQLGEHTGLSPAMLSKIERGHLFPTLLTLLRIALASASGSITFSERTATGRFMPSCARRTALAFQRRRERLHPLTASSTLTIRSATASLTAITSNLQRKLNNRSCTSTRAWILSTFWVASSW